MKEEPTRLRVLEQGRSRARDEFTTLTRVLTVLVLFLAVWMLVVLGAIALWALVKVAT